MEKSWRSKNCEMSKNESLISKNTYFHFKGPKGSVTLKAMNFIKQAQHMHQEYWRFSSDLPAESSWPAISHLNSSDLVHKKIGVKIKAYVKTFP